ncbi:hypothetical protein [Tateyamaria sp. SN6-1]|uniref:hypothetical protein n=1 Tax=Tateyamaria sp. SN6-1 TaxID=3092148 RepID=UPI0039F58A5F
MKPPSPSAVFLERRSYRRRRMMDALRLLPILGVMLLMLPLFWPAVSDTGAQAVSMSTAVIYVFLVWFLLICASFILWRGLWRGQGQDNTEAPDGADAP